MKRYLVILIFLFPVYFFAQNNADTTYKLVEFPDGFTAQLNVLYTTVNGLPAGQVGWEGNSDLSLPPKTNKPTPVVINIHGGQATAPMKRIVKSIKRY